jgi:hypothetical protein
MTGKREMSAAIVTFPQKVRQELPYRCSACGADRGCDCNAPAIEKAATALARSPEKSDRAIAKEEGINRRTVAKARNQLAHGAPVDTRVGLDGKARRMPQQHVSDDDEDNPPPDRRDTAVVADPKTVHKNLLDVLSEQRALAKACRKVIRHPGFKGFDDAARSEIRTATDRVIRQWSLFRSTLDAAGGSQFQMAAYGQRSRPRSCAVKACEPARPIC